MFSRMLCSSTKIAAAKRFEPAVKWSAQASRTHLRSVRMAAAVEKVHEQIKPDAEQQVRMQQHQ
jgi:hypothetical protein